MYSCQISSGEAQDVQSFEPEKCIVPDSQVASHPRQFAILIDDFV